VLILPSYKEIRNRLLIAGAKQIQPIIGEFELTSRCNFTCAMCYVKENLPSTDLTTRTWKTIFKAAVDAGMVYALLTGGEPFTRPDFTELYTFLFDMGVKITVYSNGSLLTDKIIETFTIRPPEFIGITLYGASDTTYFQVTGISNGFSMVDQAIEKLQKNGINVALRTLPIPNVVTDLDNIITYCRKRKLMLGYQMYIAVHRGCKIGENQQRLSPEDLVMFEHKILYTFGKETVKHHLETDASQKTCAALKSSVFITWDGYMQPCAIIDQPRKKLIPELYLKTFRLLNKKIQTIGDCLACHDCELVNFCMQCYARRQLEGNVSMCPKYLKNVAMLRREITNEKF